MARHLSGPIDGEYQAVRLSGRLVLDLNLIVLASEGAVPQALAALL